MTVRPQVSHVPPLITVILQLREDINNVLPLLLPPQVEDITRHPDYRFPFIDNDLAVLTLSESVEWTKNTHGIHTVSPVCIPGSPNNSFAYDMAEIAGWG